MHDDREEFEKNEVARDEALNQAWDEATAPHSERSHPREDEWEARDREARFDLAMERLEAEVPGHAAPGGATRGVLTEPSSHPDVSRLRKAQERVREAMTGRVMDIRSKPGARVRYAYQKHGTSGDQEQCATHLVEGMVYAVRTCRAYDSHTDVELEGVPGQKFNSVMFADAGEPLAWTGADLEPGLADVEAVAQLDLYSTGDAVIWAREFIRITGGLVDEGTALGWFANAIMVGWDHGRARLLEEQARESAAQGERPSGEVERGGEGPSPEKQAAQLCGLPVGAQGVHERPDDHEQERNEDGEHASGSVAGGVPGPRFGERLRIFIERSEGLPRLDASFAEIAAEIDRDAKTDKEALREYILGQVSQAVERLRYVVHAPVMEPTEFKSVLDAEPFLAELDRIFGDRQESQAAHCSNCGGRLPKHIAGCDEEPRQ